VPEKGSNISTALLIGSANFDLQGTSVIVPNSGLLSVSLYDINGVVFAQSSFPWEKINNKVQPVDKVAIANWISSITTDISKLDISMIPFVVGTQPGVNTFMTTLYINNNVVGVSADVWTIGSDCNNGPLLATSNCLSGF
jgi:hypothetical protein